MKGDEILTNTYLLRGKVRSLGLKYDFLAQRLSLTPYGLARKINNKSEFRASEIQTLTFLLHLSPEEKEQIFFAKKVEYIQLADGRSTD